MKSTGLVFSSRNYIGDAEPPATVLEDESRFGRDGTLAGDGAPDWVQLSSGLWYLDFDGTNDRADLGTDADFPLGSSDRSILFWFNKADVQQSAHTVLSYGTWAANQAIEITVSGGNVDLVSHTTNYLGSTSLSNNTWTQVALVVNGTNLKSYIDTVVDIDTTPHSLATVSGGAAYLGETAIGGNADYAGYIALFKIYNRALSAGEIKQIFEAKRHWFGV